MLKIQRVEQVIERERERESKIRSPIFSLLNFII